MTATPELIDALVADLRPVPAGTVWRRIAIGVGVGGLVSAVLMVLWLGLRADLADAVWTTSYWAKFIYPLLLGIAGVLAVERLGRPGGRAKRAARLAVVAVVAVLLLAAAQFMNSPPEMYRGLLMGSSAMLCPFYIVSLATPIYLGLLWVLRGLAPTRLAVAGAGAGVAGGRHRRLDLRLPLRRDRHALPRHLVQPRHRRLGGARRPHRTLRAALVIRR